MQLLLQPRSVLSEQELQPAHCGGLGIDLLQGSGELQLRLVLQLHALSVPQLPVVLLGLELGFLRGQLRLLCECFFCALGLEFHVDFVRYGEGRAQLDQLPAGVSQPLSNISVLHSNSIRKYI